MGVCISVSALMPNSQSAYMGCVCHSTLCNAVNPCLGEIRSLIRQPQGLHSVITLNPPLHPWAATTQQHFTLWYLRSEGASQRVCVWTKGEMLSVGMSDVSRHAKAHAHKHTFTFWSLLPQKEGVITCDPASVVCVCRSVCLCVGLCVCIGFFFFN